MRISENTDPAAFAHTNTRLNDVPLVPEIKLFLAHEMVPIWQLTEEELSQSGLPPPFWAFAWAGGQALARYILDNPDLVRDKHVLDFASGSGIVAIAAAEAGARSVLAADIDPFAAAACALNAEANQVHIETTTENLVGHMDTSWDVILTGDICYEQPLAGEVEIWLRSHAAKGSLVLIGDPGRTYLPKSGLEQRAVYNVRTTRELEDMDVRRTCVWEII